MPGMVASQHGWKDIANVYDYLWGFLTWSYRSLYILIVLWFSGNYRENHEKIATCVLDCRQNFT